MLSRSLWLVLPMVLGLQALESPSALQDLEKGLDRRMEDEQMFKMYYQCLLDLGPCTQDTKKFKDVVQEALERGCARCSASQQRDAIHLLRQVMECRPREYAEIERQFDPTGTFKSKYKASLAARKRRLSEDAAERGLSRKMLLKEA